MKQKLVISFRILSLICCLLFSCRKMPIQEYNFSKVLAELELSSDQVRVTS